MRFAKLAQIDTEIVTSTILVDDHDVDGNVVGQHEETFTTEKPVMGMVYRDATPEEEAEVARMAAEAAAEEANREPTVEEQLADLSEYLDVLTEMLMGGASNGY